MDLTVYNYLVPIQMQRPATKYDTHKKSELKNLVKDVMKLNDSKAPTWLVKLSDEKQSYALNIKEESMALNTSLSELSDAGDDGIFSYKKAYSDHDNVSAKLVSDHDNELPREYDIKVNHLAKKQINQGNSYPRTGKGLAAGIYRFKLEVNDDEYEFQFNIRKDANHEEIQQELAGFINKAGVGIQADVQYEDKGRVSLVLSASTTGTGKNGKGFSLQDAGEHLGNNGIVSYYNLNQVIEQPQDASFLLDGEEKKSQSNSFILNQRLLVSLQSPSEENVHISYLPDSERIISGIKEMMNGYNSLLDFTKAYTEKTGYTPKLANELNRMVRPYQNQLEACGISIDSEGRMTIDEALAVQACNEGDMQELFSEDSSFVNKLISKTNDIKLNPMEYVDKTMVTYPNTAKPGVSRSYVTSLYSGMLFNYYC